MLGFKSREKGQFHYGRIQAVETLQHDFKTNQPRFKVQSFKANTPRKWKYEAKKWLTRMGHRGYRCIQSHGLRILNRGDYFDYVILVAEKSKNVSEPEHFFNFWDLGSGSSHWILLHYEKTPGTTFHPRELNISFDCGKPAESAQNNDLACFVTHVFPELARIIKAVMTEETRPGNSSPERRVEYDQIIK